MEWSSAGDGDGDEGGPRSEGDAGAEPPLVVEGVPPDSSSLRAPVLDRGDESPVVDVEPSEEPLPSPSPVKKSGEDLDAVRSVTAADVQRVIGDVFAGPSAVSVVTPG